MHLRKYTTRAAAVAVTLAVAAGTAVATTGAAHAGGKRPQPVRTAQSAPAFLVPKELPPHPASDWYAGDVTKGLPEAAFCVANSLPTTGSSHRMFWTEYDTGANQIVVRTGSAAAAEKLAAAVEAGIRRCAADYQQQYPQSTASWRDYGTLPAEDGAHVYGVHTSQPESEPGIHLFGVGRDGRTVTVVSWGQMGDYTHAPVTEFRHTTTTAVVKLFP
ncbi:hypothetical protein IHE55_24620 [Streptomyces pactum]|uniref:Uncharacterized protein n=1 Tax=Streptomyces pactum TaxID=68249 RepID=A0ABS0NRL9_9ACTN|nr:hypothetical protein [Streptomyces pactum]MBH5337786.1 hypothetical protein [Streptomyces pactum]